MADHSKRFGKKMAFEDEAGNNYAEAFATLSAFSFDAGDEGGTVGQLRMTMRLWKGAAAYDQNKGPLRLSADGTGKEYRFAGPELEKVFGLLYNGIPVAKVITDIAWLIAESTEDMLVSPPSENGDTPALFRSFFADAVDLQ